MLDTENINNDFNLRGIYIRNPTSSKYTNEISTQE